MTERELNQLLMDSFPEIRDELLAYMEEDGDGMDTGCFLTHEDVLHPFIEKAAESNDGSLLARVAAYIEKLLDSGDEYAENVATVGFVEWLAGNQAGRIVRPLLGPKAQVLYDEYAGQ